MEAPHEADNRSMHVFVNHVYVPAALQTIVTESAGSIMSTDCLFWKPVPSWTVALC